MQEKQKPSIVIASVLKPVDDTRMTEKLAMSLAKTKDWQVHVIGFGENTPTLPGIIFHPLGIFSRISAGRLSAPWRILWIMLRIRPQQVIITTHELLVTAMLLKVFRRTKIYYDIQENYYLNIIHTQAFPAVIRPVMANYVRWKEVLMAPLIDYFFLAEQCYAIELPFLDNRFVILENKSLWQGKTPRQPIQNTIRFLFSGTLDTTTGVFHAIALIKKLHVFTPHVELTIIGYAALSTVRQKIMEQTKRVDFIHVIGLHGLVPHSAILTAIEQADVGIIYYEPAPHTFQRTPTKVYEYLAHQLPILYDQNAQWSTLIDKCSGGVAIDFKNPTVETLTSAIRQSCFYPKQALHVTWETEAVKLLQTLHGFKVNPIIID
jgi:glycosyltransferase involved in cell wall biosynthesis